MDVVSCMARSHRYGVSDSLGVSVFHALTRAALTDVSIGSRVPLVRRLPTRKRERFRGPPTP